MHDGQSEIFVLFVSSSGVQEAPQVILDLETPPFFRRQNFAFIRQFYN